MLRIFNYNFWMILVMCFLYTNMVFGFDFFSDTTDLEKLLKIEAQLIENLKKFAATEDDILSFLERRLANYEYHHKLATADISAYLANPINAFLITKRLTSDWKEIEEIIGRDLEEEMGHLTKDLELPDEHDLNGAAVGLKRLQETYNLNISDMIRGELNGKNFGSVLSASDCFVIGVELNLNSDYYHSVLWLTEASKRLEFENPLRDAQVYQFLANSLYAIGDIAGALNATNAALLIIPNDKLMIENKIFFEEKLKENHGENQLATGIAESVQNTGKSNNQTIGIIDADETYRHFQKLCRSEVKPSPQQLAPLKCRYASNKSLFLKIAPLKLEELSLDPLIVLYHNVLFDNEIEFIINESKPKLEVGKTKNEETGENQHSYVRTSKVTFLNDSHFQEIRDLELRVQDMTGLSLKSAERLQVVHYDGIGGHYDPHIDFFTSRGRKGNRIATVLFYMTDVSHGGATVFPHLNVVVPAEKGKAVFWFNLHRSGDGDYRTRHGSCPVLIGSKWICNKWLREHDQESLRPCELYRDALKSNLLLAEKDNSTL